MSLVALRKVSKKFGSHTVLDQVDLDVEPGDVVAIIGRSGSGKSTLLRVINGLESIDGGTITVAGQQVSQRRRDLRRLHRSVGIVFQSYNLFPHLSVERNITLGPTVGKGVSALEAARIAREVLASVGLADKLKEYPSRLSGGQQQRAAIARALAMQPALLLFDEITSALDPELTYEVVRVLQQLAHDGRTMILITHEMGAARSASRVLFMHQARIWEDGTPERVFDDPQTPELKAFLAAIIRH